MWPGITFVALLLATGLMRLVELGVSLSRLRSRPGEVIAEPWLFPAMAALHAGLVVLPLAEVWWLDRPFVPWLGACSAAVLVAATALRVWTLGTLGRMWNVRVLPPTTVVTTGPYRFIRHPNYLCVILELAALPLFHQAWLSAIALSLWNGLVLARRIPTEEAALAQVPGWREAFAHRARLVPGLF
jgi:methyltransferase